MAPVAVLRLGGDTADSLRVSWIWYVCGDLKLIAAVLAVGHGKSGTGMVFQNMRLPFRTAPIHLIAVLTIVNTCRLQNRQVQFRYRFRRYFRMAFGQVIDQHAASLETHQAGVAFVYKPMEIGGLLGLFRGRVWLRSRHRYVILPLVRVHPLAVLRQLVLALELLAAAGAQELPVI